MSAVDVIFQHELVRGGEPLVVETGMEDIEWAYNLNVAEFPTYGGEVVQILAVFIDDLTIKGVLRSYAELESVYGYFMEYFTVATQGSSQNATEGEKFTQVPMILEYPQRNWRFEIQPLEAPGFLYGQEVITPEWEMKAHVVDKSPDVKKLQDLVAQELVNKEKFALKGIISLQGGEPANNPFVAPGVVKGDKFTEDSQKAIEERLGRIGSYYHQTIIPSYLDNTFVQSLTEPGAKPAFGNSQGAGENEAQLEAKGKPGEEKAQGGTGK